MLVATEARGKQTASAGQQSRAPPGLEKPEGWSEPLFDGAELLATTPSMTQMDPVDVTEINATQMKDVLEKADVHVDGHEPSMKPGFFWHSPLLAHVVHSASLSLHVRGLGVFHRGHCGGGLPSCGKPQPPLAWLRW